jgi:hypothetical protein
MKPEAKYPGLQTRIGDALVFRKTSVSLFLVGAVVRDGATQMGSDYKTFTTLKDAQAHARELVVPERRMYLIQEDESTWSDFT